MSLAYQSISVIGTILRNDQYNFFHAKYTVMDLIGANITFIIKMIKYDEHTVIGVMGKHIFLITVTLRRCVYTSPNWRF